jgi:hypothetical protein
VAARPSANAESDRKRFSQLWTIVIVNDPFMNNIADSDRILNPGKDIVQKFKDHIENELFSS